MSLNYRRYAEISKVEAQEDGTIKVWGYASSAAEDSDGEVIQPSAMKAALPDYLKFGAVREMHGSSAAGTAIEANVEDDGKTFFGAHIVDPVAVKKVQAKVYKGFSIGGKITERDEVNKSLITGIKLVEISLVDRPANPEAVFTMFKAEGVEEGADADEVVELPELDAPPLPAADAPAEKAVKVTPTDREAINAMAEMVNKGEITPALMLEAARKAVAPAAQIEFGKGMGDLSRFAELLRCIGWFVTAQNQEKSWEGDNSPVPAKLNAWLAEGLAIFQSMTAEESAELLTYTAPADMSGDADKADKATLTSLQASLDALLAKVSAVVPVTAAEPVAPVVEPLAGDLLKAAITESAETLLKAALAERDAVITDLQKRIKLLEDTPLPAKGPLRIVGKGEDIGTLESSDPVVSPVIKADGTVDEPATLAKGIFMRGPQTLAR